MNIKLICVGILLASVLAREKLHHLNTPVSKPVPVPPYTQTEHYFEQIVDHYDYVDVDTWKQRYFAIEDFFNPTAGPVLLYICGEYTCPGIPEARKWAIILAQRTQGLVLVLEHRFYGKSMPFGGKSLSLQNLKLLTTEQALKDLAYFIEQVKARHLHRVDKSPWITIGGSYPGAMSAWFRFKYPHLTVGSIASSAVVNAIEDFKMFDEQIYISSHKSGDYCNQGIARVSEDVEELVTGPKADEFKAQFKAKDLSASEFMFYWADVTVELIQYGSRTRLCNKLKNKTRQQQLQQIKSEALKSDPADYGSFFLKNETYAINSGGGARSWTFQVCTEFGWLQTFSNIHPMRSKLLSIQFFRNWCQDIFGKGVYPKVQWSNTELGGLQKLSTNLFMVNGVEDPWIWAGMTKSAGGITSRVADCDNCAHCVDLYTPSKDDSLNLTKIRNSQYLMILKWIEDYWRELHPKGRQGVRTEM